jgi:SARP family transcriptional regulator, regulator of embCAB operon
MEPNSAPQQRIVLHLLGSLRIQRGDVMLGAHDLGGIKPRQILEILLLHPGIPISKERIIELVWGQDAPGEAVATLQSYVSVLRRFLQPGGSRNGPLQTVNAGYVIDRSMVESDLDQFDALVRAAEHAPPAAAYPLLCRALELADEPLLGDELTAEWAESERSLHAIRVASLRIQAAETAVELGRPDEAILWAQTALATDQLNERAWTALILAMEQAGRFAEGLQAYERCRRVLQQELGCAPGPVLRDAYTRLLSVTADTEGDLSEALSALLYLHEQLSQAGRDGAPDASASLRAAGDVLSNFLHKALAAA